MKAAVFRGPRDVAVEELERPQLLPGDLLVRVTACGICGSDLHIYKHGPFPQAIGVPVASGFVLGHENSGEVVEICGEVDGFKGERAIPYDSLIVSLGRKRNDSLLSELQGRVPEVYKIGDCEHNGNINHAIQTANEVARKI